MKILAMAKLLVAAVVRGDVNAQYHYAHKLMLDALARGANGPETAETESL